VIRRKTQMGSNVRLFMAKGIFTKEEFLEMLEKEFLQGCHFETEAEGHYTNK
jgi:hypothetical protein